MTSLYRNQLGKILTEAFVVFGVIALLWVVGVREYRAMQAFSEQMIYERTIAVIERAMMFAHNKQLMQGINTPDEYWLRLNPVSVLTEPMRGYVGELTEADMLTMEPMAWAYLPTQHQLVYRVSSTGYFSSESDGFGFIRLVPHVSRQNNGQYLMLSLDPLEKFAWHNNE